MKKLIITGIISLCICFRVSGGDKISWGMDAACHYGFLVAHRSTMLHLIDSHLKGAEFTIFKQTNGNAPWHQTYRYPRTGLNFIYLDLPSDKILGNAAAAMLFIDMPVISDKHYHFTVRSSFGFGYLTRHFLREENYKNTAIGSALNAAIQLNFQNVFPVSKHLEYHLSLGLTHFSNGSFSTPNLGINNLTFNSGITYLFSLPDTFYRHEVKPFPRKWTLETILAAGVKEIYPPDGSKYFASTVMVNYMKQISYKSKWGGGIDIFYDPVLKHELEVKNESTEDLVPLRSGVHAGFSMMINRLSMLIEMGAYITDPLKDQGPLYHRLGIRYALTRNLFFNMTLKTHFAKAEYTEWGLGWKFNTMESL